MGLFFFIFPAQQSWLLASLYERLSLPLWTEGLAKWHIFKYKSHSIYVNLSLPRKGWIKLLWMNFDDSGKQEHACKQDTCYPQCLSCSFFLLHLSSKCKDKNVFQLGKSQCKVIIMKVHKWITRFSFYDLMLTIKCSRKKCHLWFHLTRPVLVVSCHLTQLTLNATTFRM